MNVRANPMLSMPAIVTILGLMGCGQHGSLTRTSPLAPDVGANSGEFASGPGGPAAVLSRVAPDFDPDDFVSRVDNPYFPLVPGTVYTYVGETEEGEETVEVRVNHETKQILGVMTTEVRDRVFSNGSLIEDTFDWYAQDEDGNVWYFGEDTKEYENGAVVSTAGTWLGGQDGAKPGIIMLARPRPGHSYLQEFAPGVAEDMARVISLNRSVSVPFGAFTHCLQTFEWTPLDRTAREFKYYARGVGQVLTVSRRGGHRVELKSVSRP